MGGAITRKSTMIEDTDPVTYTLRALDPARVSAAINSLEKRGFAETYPVLCALKDSLCAEDFVVSDREADALLYEEARMLRHDVELASVGSEALPLADLADFFSVVSEAYYIAHHPKVWEGWAKSPSTRISWAMAAKELSITIQGRVK